MRDERILRTLRCMAWARIKGEMLALLNTYWDSKDDDSYDRILEEWTKFKKLVDDNGWAE